MSAQISSRERLQEKIEGKTARVGVIGLGYVGLPMAELAATNGFDVIGVDVDALRVERLNRGESYILDVPSEVVRPLVEQGKIRASTDYAALAEADIVLITVPTPLNKTGDPDMSFVITSLQSLKPWLHAGMLVALESTTYPGTTHEMFVPVAEEAGLKVGEDIFIAFSPERVDPGNTHYTTKNTPKVVGGVTARCTEIATAYYQRVVDEVVPVSSTTAAEMVKLYENTFRAINIGLVNELAIICNLLGTDVWEIIEAAKTKPFGFMPFYPGPGLGGHCIPIDPSYLAWRMRTLQYRTRFIELATEINSQMPEYVVNRSMEMLNERGRSLKGAKLLLLGMAYKQEIDDLRESPALDVFDLLKRKGAEVNYHDPYCPTVAFDGGTVASTPLTPEIVQQQDLVIITTGHRSVDYEMVLEHAGQVFDTRNVVRPWADKAKAEVVFL